MKIYAEGIIGRGAFQVPTITYMGVFSPEGLLEVDAPREFAVALEEKLKKALAVFAPESGEEEEAFEVRSLEGGELLYLGDRRRFRFTI